MKSDTEGWGSSWSQETEGLPLGWGGWKKRRDWERYKEMREGERVIEKWGDTLSMSLKNSSSFDVLTAYFCFNTH